MKALALDTLPKHPGAEVGKFPGEVVPEHVGLGKAIDTVDFVMRKNLKGHDTRIWNHRGRKAILVRGNDADWG